MMKSTFFPALSVAALGNASSSERFRQMISSDSASLFGIAKNSSVAAPATSRMRSGELVSSISEGTDGSTEELLREILSCKRRGPGNWRQIDPTSRILVAAMPLAQRISICDMLIAQGYQHLSVIRDNDELEEVMLREHPDLIVFDADEGQESCLQTLERMAGESELSATPVLVIGSQETFRREALQAGACDYAGKPLEAEDLLPKVRNSILIHRSQINEGWVQQRLLEFVTSRTAELEISRNELIRCLARAAEFRDNETGNHVVRVGRYSAIIARQMGYPEERLKTLEEAAQMHDVGKIGIPDSILFKPGRLVAEEYELIKKHCSLGRQIIEPLSGRERDVLNNHTTLGRHLMNHESSGLLMLAASIAQNHHEHWDGSGYPHGLSGEEIPLEGRIVAVADVYDALSSRRPYKDPFPRSKCLEVIAEGRGTQFDPDVVDAFFDCADRIREVQLELMDLEEAGGLSGRKSFDDIRSSARRSGHAES